MKNARPRRFRWPGAQTPDERLRAWRQAQAPRTGSRAAGRYDRDWQHVRQLVLEGEPLCRECARHGAQTRATTVDHIIPLRDDPSLRLDPANLQPLCWPCHRRKTNRQDGGFGRRQG